MSQSLRDGWSHFFNVESVVHIDWLTVYLERVLVLIYRIKVLLVEYLNVGSVVGAPSIVCLSFLHLFGQIETCEMTLD